VIGISAVEKRDSAVDDGSRDGDTETREGVVVKVSDPLVAHAFGVLTQFCAPYQMSEASRLLGPFRRSLWLGVVGINGRAGLVENSVAYQPTRRADNLAVSDILHQAVGIVATVTRG
jgi:hypothetical protein